MTTVLCTLYNSLYLDKGLVLYDSLCASAKDFKLYVLCMDDKCYDVLRNLNQENHIPVRLTDFEASDEVLLTAKGNRSFGEFCWTCSSSFIWYVLKHYGEDNCTYVDADMYFYQDPAILVDEMIKAGKTVMITPHRFTPEKMHFVKNGTYCVEFNTFLNEESSLKVLRKWCDQCLECCTSVYDGVHFGDQKYLDPWPEEFPDVVHVCQHPGAGTAPWNIGWYRQKDAGRHIVIYKKDETEVPVIFHHYHQITYETRQRIRTGILEDQPNVDYNLVKDLYLPYLQLIEVKKQMLESKYKINFVIKDHPAYSKISGWKRWLLNNKLGKIVYKTLSTKKNTKHFVVILPSR